MTRIVRNDSTTKHVNCIGLGINAHLMIIDQFGSSLSLQEKGKKGCESDAHHVIPAR